MSEIVTKSSTSLMNNNTPKPTPYPRSQKPCSFFAQGSCKHGDDCRFSHILAPINPSVGAPPPVMITIPFGQPVFSIDVECVASGTTHNARSIAQVALVDEWSRPVFNVFIKQDLPVVSYISELTGLSKEILDQYGLPLGKNTRKSSQIHFLTFFFCFS
jgi:RNA exonuclease 4